MTDNIGRQVKIAAIQLTKRFDRFANQYGLTSTQMSVIDFLSDNETQGVGQKAIEIEFNIRRSTASTLLKRMEDKGLITRTAIASDARQKVVQLTPLSHQYAKDIKGFMDNTQTLIHQHLSDHDYQTLVNSLEQIIKIMGD
jgi:MarR family transcriptional regulator, repressor for mepA